MASSSEPPYLNGKRVPNLDRSERTFSSGFVVTRSGASALVAASGSLPTLSQCLSFEPIQISDLGTDRSVELKRVMGIIVGSTSEENSSGAAAAEDLKRLRSSVVDTCNTARGRVSKLDEHLNKLDKYCEGILSKKTQKNEFMANDKSDALNLKIVNQRVEDRPKSVILNKRVRTSVAETRAECRSNGLRRQPVVMTKDRDLLKENDGESDNLEEKIPKFPAGGEGWDKKMKRKRSVGTVSTRSMDSNGEKRTAQKKAASEPVLQSNDTHSYRLGASNGTGTTHKMDNKLEGPSLPDSSRACVSPRSELEGPTSSGSNKEKILTKGNNKLNTRDDDNIPNGNLVTKSKASRITRRGAMVVASSSPSTPCLTGTPESWENVPGGAMNRKRATPSGSPSPGMAQWAGQRQQKMSRTRRSNMVPPVSSKEEKPLSSDSCSLSDVTVSVKLPSDGTNGPLISEKLKPKQEPVQSPHRLNESGESVGGQSHGQNVGPFLAVEMKVKSIIIEENGKDVKRPLTASASSTITGVKLDNTPLVNPIRRNKTGCEKNGSKSGRPLKKLSDRKGVSGVGHKQNGGSDCTGKSDDHEELMAAVNHARKASYLACSSNFWKRMEPIFAPVSSKDKVYLSTQLKEPDIQENFSQFHGRANNVMMNFTHEVSIYNTNCSGERNMHVKHQGSESFSGRLDSDKSPKEFIPLFQRVLSALIIEDTINELEEENTQIIPLQDAFCDSTYDRFHLDDFSEPRKRARREVEHDTVFQSIHSVKMSFSSNGCTDSFRSTAINDSPCDDVALTGIPKNLVNRSQVIQMGGFGIPSFDNQYDQMCLDDKVLLELHSIGLYPELVPKLDDKEDETIKREIKELKTRLRQQNYKKKAYLEQICKSIGSSFVARDLEQLAFDKLVEIAYRKFLATRGPSRSGTLKIPKHIAMAFGRRTLARCRKFAKSGASCFNVAPLRDILLAPQEVELFDDVSTAYQSERKIKVHPTGRTPTSGNGCGNQSARSLHPVQPSLNGPNHNRDVDPLHDLDPIEELGVGGPQDLSSLLNFDDEELQDDFSAGLEIPMDDLTELNMF